MAFKPIDPKRDEYRRYLERGGIIESLTKVFVRILRERPEDPTQYLLQNLGDARLQADNIAYLQSELEDARIEIQRLTAIIRSVNPELLNETSKESILNDAPCDSVNSNEVEEPSSTLNSQNLQSNDSTSTVTLEESVKETHINVVPSEAEAGQNRTK